MPNLISNRFQAHLDFAHQCWKELVLPGDIVIDATAGNGLDSLFLAKLCLTSHSGLLFTFDIQAQAIQTTKNLLTNELDPSLLERVSFQHRSHTTFPQNIQPNSVKLIVYNLGYLPGGDKSLTTQIGSTLESLQAAQQLLLPGGIICMTCYPGHEEGQLEEKTLLNYTSALNFKEWNCSHHRWINRPRSPSVLLLLKR